MGLHTPPENSENDGTTVSRRFSMGVGFQGRSSKADKILTLPQMFRAAEVPGVPLPGPAGHTSPHGGLTLTENNLFNQAKAPAREGLLVLIGGQSCHAGSVVG